MKGKRIWILMLCCMLVLSLAAVPGHAADMGNTHTVYHAFTVIGLHTRSEKEASSGSTVTMYFTSLASSYVGFLFRGWDIPDGLTLTEGDNKSKKISFIMPDHDVTITEQFEALGPVYQMVRRNNISKNSYTAGNRVSGFPIPTSPVAPSGEGYRFYEWEGLEGLTITEGDKYTEKLTIIMPEHDVDLKALYILFDDVLPGAYCFDPVVWAVERGVTNGTTDTTFSPSDTCKTAHILTFLWRANGSPEPSAANPFSDVPSGSYYEKAAVWAYENGLVSGNAFNGDSFCTRAATMKYLWILAGSPPSGTTPFTDVSPSADYAKAVSWAVAQGVTNGTTATTFSPDNTCTRGQIATFLYRHYAQ